MYVHYILHQVIGHYLILLDPCKIGLPNIQCMFKLKYPVSLWFSHDADQVVDENAGGSLAGEHLLQLTEAQRRLVVHLLNSSKIKELKAGRKGTFGCLLH